MTASAGGCFPQRYVDQKSGHPSPGGGLAQNSQQPVQSHPAGHFAVPSSQAPARSPSSTCQTLFLTLEVGRARLGPCLGALRLVGETQRRTSVWTVMGGRTVAGVPGEDDVGGSICPRLRLDSILGGIWSLHSPLEPACPPAWSMPALLVSPPPGSLFQSLLVLLSQLCSHGGS